jgi:hypothetical protein
MFCLFFRPLAGLLRASCVEDQNLVECARRCGTIYLVDARPKISAYANQAKVRERKREENIDEARSFGIVCLCLYFVFVVCFAFDEKSSFVFD